MLFIIPILLFVITCLCLPQLMIQILIGAFGYVTCRALSKRNMAKMIIVITVFSCLSVIMEKVLPLVEEEQKKQKYVENKIDYIKKYIDPTAKLYTQEQVDKYIDDKINDSMPDKLKFINQYPKVKYDKNSNKENKEE